MKEPCEHADSGRQARHQYGKKRHPFAGRHTLAFIGELRQSTARLQAFAEAAEGL